MVGKAKSNAFSRIKHRVCQKLQTWKDKQLSQGGKAVLLKVAALFIPTYAMSFFILPNCLCNELESMMTHFGGEKKKMKGRYIGSVEKMCDSKFKGGLGFKDL